MIVNRNSMTAFSSCAMLVTTGSDWLALKVNSQSRSNVTQQLRNVLSTTGRDWLALKVNSQSRSNATTVVYTSCVALKRDWLLLLEPTNHIQCLTRYRASAERSHWITIYTHRGASGRKQLKRGHSTLTISLFSARSLIYVKFLFLLIGYCQMFFF